MKKLYILIAILLMSGCSAKSPQKVEKEVLATLESNVHEVTIASTNHNKPYYRYYLPERMGLVESNALSSVLKIDGFPLVMNFTPSTIIISEYYSGDDNEEVEGDIEFKHFTEESLKSLTKNTDIQFEDNKEISVIVEEHKQIDYDISVANKETVTTFSGNYQASNDENYYYFLKLKRINDTYYVHFNGTIITLTTIVPAEKVNDMVFQCLTIAKSVNYDRDKVLKDYSLKYALEQMKQNNEENNNYIFEHLPSEGYLQELLSDE